jgi:predicted RNA-binding protein with PIN domain
MGGGGSPSAGPNSRARGGSSDQPGTEVASTGGPGEASTAAGAADSAAHEDTGTDERQPVEDGGVGVLPEPVRQRVVALAANALGALPVSEVPASLRQFVRFAPQKRARLAATPIAAALAADGGFRSVVASRVREAMPDLAAALSAGAVPAAADPLDIAAVAYLLRPDGWQGHVGAAGREVERSTVAADSAAATEAMARAQEQLAAARAAAKADVDRLRSELDRAKAEISDLRHKLHDTRQQAKQSALTARTADEAAELARADAAATQANADAELRRMKARLADAEQTLESARRTAREGRSIEDVRLRLLLDTVLDAAQGLRRELALPPTTIRPADTVEALEAGSAGVESITDRAREADDPTLLDQLLALPQAHLVIDGYNVTKTGFANLPLEAQRARLVSGLSGLAAQSGAEITCVFDGAALTGPVPSAAPRGVRVLFSKPGQTADDLIRRLVRAEPPGRPVVVVSSDREVAEGVRKAGARALPAAALIKRLARG